MGKSAYKSSVKRTKKTDYVNVKYKDNREGGIYLDRVEWSFVADEDDPPEYDPEDILLAFMPSSKNDSHKGHTPEIHTEDTNDTFVVFIPRHKWGSQQVLDAKAKELKNFRLFGVYKYVPDCNKKE